jgi:chemotaxis protein MotB
VARKIKKGLPPWMGTFADMCTLLLTFFVLLLTFANMDVKKFQDMLGSVKNAFGVQLQDVGKFQPVLPEVKPQPTRTRMIQPTMPEPAIQDARDAAEAAAAADRVKDMVNAVGLGNAVEIKSGPRGVRMRVKGQLLFEPGAADVRESARKLLDNVAKVMNKFNFYLTVEGHSDNQPIRTTRFPSNWELSAARASSVLRTLVGMGVPPRRVSAVGYASNYPIASNSNEEGRNKNRRVEFVFTKKPLRVGVE